MFMRKVDIMTLKKIYLELTNRCNLNCTICYRQSWNDTPLDMDRELFRKIKQELKEMDTLQEVVLGGIGEPTHAPLICEAIEDLKDYKLTLTTNAVDLNDTVLEAVVKHVDLVMVSIDGLKENYAKIRCAELEHVLENIKRINILKKAARKQTPVLGIQFVISQDNVEDIFMPSEKPSG